MSGARIGLGITCARCALAVTGRVSGLCAAVADLDLPPLWWTPAMQAAARVYGQTLYRSDGYGFRVKEIIEAYEAVRDTERNTERGDHALPYRPPASDRMRRTPDWGPSQDRKSALLAKQRRLERDTEQEHKR